MPGKMCAALNQFFTRRHAHEEAKLQEKLWAVSEKIMIYYLHVSKIVKPFEERSSWASEMPSS